MMTTGSVISIKSYYSLMKGLRAHGSRGLEVPLLGRFLKKHGLEKPSVSNLMFHYLCIKDVDRALRFLSDYMALTNIQSITFPLKILAKDGRALDAYKLVKGAANRLPVLDVVDYSIVVDGLCKEGHIDISLDLCALARKNAITPNIVTYNSVLYGLCQQGCFTEAFRLFDSLPRVDLVPTEVTYAILIDTLCKEGLLLDARLLFDKMVSEGHSPNTHICNSLIDGHCKFGKLEDALDLLLDLKNRGLEPDEFTISSVIKGYCLKGDIEGAHGFFYDIKRKGGLPDFLGFLYLVSGLSGKGRMEEARTILREMPQTTSVHKLINRVDEEVDMESVSCFLVSLCEQGRIEEAITVLHEIGSAFFPFRRRLSFIHRALKSKVDISSNGCTSAAVSNGTVASKPLSLENKPSYGGFDAYYSDIASLCSSGELQQANSLVKEMLLQFTEGYLYNCCTAKREDLKLKDLIHEFHSLPSP